MRREAYQVGSVVLVEVNECAMRSSNEHLQTRAPCLCSRRCQLLYAATCVTGCIDGFLLPARSWRRTPRDGMALVVVQPSLGDCDAIRLTITYRHMLLAPRSRQPPIAPMIPPGRSPSLVDDQPTCLQKRFAAIPKSPRATRSTSVRGERDQARKTFVHDTSRTWTGRTVAVPSSRCAEWFIYSSATCEGLRSHCGGEIVSVQLPMIRKAPTLPPKIVRVLLRKAPIEALYTAPTDR
ncbi:hypothetical protein BKA67DRAFT_216935 [Truncatella angustata]|uniref:Uncharacterized protein n=1 Tax=Truncatella angustata TaxID=152316 RepID=A0A9P9A337_9PEZI|nr:uncharacterized protein BKA67DRAFT_216935 [Truncatella angustata]KAH6658550.1 hypothetical protein BKA67DRAFT_216935 [Truncatella angustata]